MVHRLYRLTEKAQRSDGSACCSKAHGEIARTDVMSLPHGLLEYDPLVIHEETEIGSQLDRIPFSVDVWHYVLDW